MYKKYRVVFTIKWQGIQKGWFGIQKPVIFTNLQRIVVVAKTTTEAVAVATEKLRDAFSILHSKERQERFYEYSYFNDWLDDPDYPCASYTLKAPQCVVTDADRIVTELKDYSNESVETLKKELTLEQFLEMVNDIRFKRGEI